LFTSGGSIAFFPDNELPRQDASGNRKMIDFLRGTDVLVMDTQFDTEEYQQHTGWGHGCLDDVVALALQAEVKKLFLFHHDPNHDDAKISQMLADARKLVAALKGKLKVEAAREGVTVELPAVARA
jgi:ribonuclease BN (tRNA processing enzyme)